MILYDSSESDSGTEINKMSGCTYSDEPSTIGGQAYNYDEDKEIDLFCCCRKPDKDDDFYEAENRNGWFSILCCLSKNKPKHNESIGC